MSVATNLLAGASVVLFSLQGSGEAGGCAGGHKIEGARLSSNGMVLLTRPFIGPISFHESIGIHVGPRMIHIGADLDGALGGETIYINSPDGVVAIPEGQWVKAEVLPGDVRGTIFVDGLWRWIDPEEYIDITVGGDQEFTAGELCHDGAKWYWRR